MNTTTQIAVAVRMAKIDKSICARCGARLGESGYIVETDTMTFAICDDCNAQQPTPEPHDMYSRQKAFECVRRWSSDVNEENCCQTFEERAVLQALGLGLEVHDRRGNRVLWGFDYSSGGWSGDGDSAPSWYSASEQRWTEFVVQSPAEIRVQSNLKYPLTITL